MRSADDYCFWVYLLSSRSRNLYIGLTSNLRKRIHEHREFRPGTHTALYRIHRLVYVEQFQYINNAISREKEMKRWTRAQKLTLINAANPTWQDLAADWFPNPIPRYNH